MSNYYKLSHPLMVLEDQTIQDETFENVTDAVTAAYHMSRLYDNTPVKIISIGIDANTEAVYETTINRITAPAFDDDNLPTYGHLEYGLG